MSDLANVLFLLVLLPHHIVHLIQALSSLFVRLQLHLAVLKGCLENKTHTTQSVCVFFRVFQGLVAVTFLTSSFFWLDCKIDSFSFLSCSCSSLRELILSVAAVSCEEEKNTQTRQSGETHPVRTQALHLQQPHNCSHTQFF